jgi:hypothetical protein
MPYRYPTVVAFGFVMLFETGCAGWPVPEAKNFSRSSPECRPEND